MKVELFDIKGKLRPLEDLKWELELEIRRLMPDKWNKMSAKERYNLVEGFLMSLLKKLKEEGFIKDVI